MVQNKNRLEKIITVGKPYTKPLGIIDSSKSTYNEN